MFEKNIIKVGCQKMTKKGNVQFSFYKINHSKKNQLLITLRESNLFFQKIFHRVYHF